MLISESYVELINQAYSRTCPYPVACYEIFMLDQAKHRAKRTEQDQFRQLGILFDWDMPRKQSEAYVKKLAGGSTLVLTDSTKTIVWTSQSFLAMTGFTKAESVGKKPGMLQGPKTDRSTLLRVRDSLGRADSVEAHLLNYRKNGEAYTCHLFIDPLFNTMGEVTHFLAVEDEIR